MKNDIFIKQNIYFKIRQPELMLSYWTEADNIQCMCLCMCVRIVTLNQREQDK